MMPATRVAIAILFSAFAVWAQIPGGSDSFKIPLPAFPDQSQALPTDQQFRFKLNLPPKYSSSRNFVIAENAVVLPDPQTAGSAQSTPKSFSFSKGYLTRWKIHKYASIATLPLVVSEVIVGEKLDDSTDGDSFSSAHSALAAGIGVLFGVESVTGIWNMLESRKNPSPGRGKQLFHGILMLAADAGFVATAALAPDNGDDEPGVRNDASTHRAVAYASLGVAAFSYIYMLLAK